MINPKCIFPECHAETFLIEIIKGYRPKEPNHKNNKTQALAALDGLDAEKALGIVDKDPHARAKIDLSKIGYNLRDSGDEFLKLFSHQTKNFKIIEINKEFEDWLKRKAIPESGINPPDHGIPEDWYEKDYFKSDRIRNKPGVYPFFKALIKSDSESMKIFLRWVEENT